MGLLTALRLRRPPAVPARGSQQPVAAGKRKRGMPSAAGPLHERRRRLVSAREATMRDLGGLMLEMYKRNRFREDLLLDKCEEVLSIEVEVAHIDQRLFQLAPPTSAGTRPIGRCECGSPVYPGQNFCGVCGRSFSTLTQTRVCERCGTALRPGDSFCGNCGAQAPDVLDAIETVEPPIGDTPQLSAGPAVSGQVVSGGADLAPPPLDLPGEIVIEPAQPAQPAADAAITAALGSIPAQQQPYQQQPQQQGQFAPQQQPFVPQQQPQQGQFANVQPLHPGAQQPQMQQQTPQYLSPRDAKKLAKERAKIMKARRKAKIKEAKERAKAARKGHGPGGGQQ